MKNWVCITLVFVAVLYGAIAFAGTRQVPAGAVGDSQLTESHLNAVDAAVDEECLTFEVTIGDFEWQSCGAGAETNTLEGDPPPNVADTEVFIGTGPGAGAFSPLTGDVTMSNAGVTTIGADKVTEGHLKAVDAAADEECLTYEGTVGDFEWQACGGTAHTNGANCPAGAIPRGVDENGVAEECYEPVEADIQDLAHTTDAGDLSTGTIPLDRVGNQHINALAEMLLCASTGADSVLEFDDTTGVPVCKDSIKVTNSGEADGDLLLWQNGTSDWRNKPMSGDAAIAADGTLTLDPDLNFLTTGTIRGNLNVIVDATASDNPTAAELRGSFFVYSNAGVVTITLPDIDTVGIGASGCWYDSDPTALIKIEVDIDDIITLDNTTLDAGDTIDSAGGQGNFICLVAIDADTNWVSLGRAGAWVDGGAT